MPSQYPCDKCDYIACRRSDLVKHQNRKYKCDAGPQCNVCRKYFANHSSLSDHKKHRCPGRPEQTPEEKDKEIRDLKIALDAVRGMGEVVTNTDNSRPIVNVNVTINQTDITNIQNNITVNAAGHENIDYIRSMSLDGFKDAIGGLTPNHSTVSNMFKLVRINEEHPENHNLLLPDRDGDFVHWKSKDGWKTMKYDDKIRGLVSGDIINVLDSKIRGPDRDVSFYWGYIVHEIMRKCGEVDHAGLKPIYDDIRDPLHEQTMKYVRKFKEATQNQEEEELIGATVAEATEELNLNDVRMMMSKLQMIEKQLTRRDGGIQISTT